MSTRNIGCLGTEQMDVRSADGSYVSVSLDIYNYEELPNTPSHRKYLHPKKPATPTVVITVPSFSMAAVTLGWR